MISHITQWDQLGRVKLINERHYFHSTDSVYELNATDHFFYVYIFYPDKYESLVSLVHGQEG